MHRRPKLKKNGPKLCGDCPFLSFLQDVQPKSYTTTPTEETAVKVCSKLRALAKKWGWPPCKHYPPTERIDLYATA